MNSWKIIFWASTIALGFISPVISFVLILLYYLPQIANSLFKEYANLVQKENMENYQQYQRSQNQYSSDTLEEMK